MTTAVLSASAQPFAMQFASVPTGGAIMEMSASTLTSTYSTDCGPNNSPDDGQDTSMDD